MLLDCYAISCKYKKKEIRNKSKKESMYITKCNIPSSMDKETVLENIKINMIEKYEIAVENIKNMLYRCETVPGEDVRLMRETGQNSLVITDNFMTRLDILLTTFEKHYVPASRGTYDTIFSIHHEFDLRKERDYSSSNQMSENERFIMSRLLSEEEFVLCALLLNYRIVFNKKIKQNNERLNLRLCYFSVFIKNRVKTIRHRII